MTDREILIGATQPHTPPQLASPHTVGEAPATGTVDALLRIAAWEVIFGGTGSADNLRRIIDTLIAAGATIHPIDSTPQ